MIETQQPILAEELKKPAYAMKIAARDYAGIAAALNARPLIDNPDKESVEIPVALTLKMVMLQVPPAEMVKAYQLPGFVADVKKAIDDQDREYLAVLLAIAVSAGAISVETVAKLTPMLTATTTVTPPAKIEGASIAQAFGLGGVTVGDVQLTAHRYMGA